MAGWFDILSWMREADSGIPETTVREELEVFREQVAIRFELRDSNAQLSRAFEEFLHLPRPFVFVREDVAIDGGEVQAAWTDGHNRYFWERLQRFLTEKRGWTTASLIQLNEGSERVLQRLQPPGVEGDRRGGVIGYVQSGKTANMAAVIAKAADCGYRLVIVLAGTLENLRQQTQIRFDSELIGSVGGFMHGIATVKKDSVLRKDWQPLTSADVAAGVVGDVLPGVGALEPTPPAGPIIAVIKKNPARIKALLSRIGGKGDWKGLDGWQDLPCLVIDDESDTASINTLSRKALAQVTATNKAIRGLLNSFRCCTYVGYTATPYANLFIDAFAATEKLGADLFPRDFLVLLKRPSGYVGARHFFGIRQLSTDDVEEDRLPMFCDFVDPIVDAEPVRLCGVATIAEAQSLRDAVLAFILSCACRALRGQGSEDMSMLINPGPMTTKHDAIRTLIRKYVKPPADAEVLPTTFVEQLQLAWGNHFTSAGKTSIDGMRRALADRNCADHPAYHYDTASCVTPTFAEVLSQVPAVLSKLEVVALNGTTSSTLAYGKRNDPKRYIVVGGNKLSRGLTLEGLSVSYFLRAPAVPCYDTLMQMGRWFGYRKGYLDLCRIWAPSDTIDNYAQIAAADEALRQMIERDCQKLKPVDVPPYIFRFDGMSIVAANKLGVAVRLTASGVRLEETHVDFAPSAVNSRNASWGALVNGCGPYSATGNAFVSQRLLSSGEVLGAAKAAGVKSLNLTALEQLVAKGDTKTTWRVAVAGITGAHAVGRELFAIPGSELSVLPVSRRFVAFGPQKAPTGYGFKVVGNPRDFERLEISVDFNADGYLFVYAVARATPSGGADGPRVVLEHIVAADKIVNDELTRVGYADAYRVGPLLVPVLKMPRSNTIGLGDYFGQVGLPTQLEDDA